MCFYSHSSHLIYSNSELTTSPEQNLEGPRGDRQPADLGGGRDQEKNTNPQQLSRWKKSCKYPYLRKNTFISFRIADTKWTLQHKKSFNQSLLLWVQIILLGDRRQRQQSFVSSAVKVTYLIVILMCSLKKHTHKSNLTVRYWPSAGSLGIALTRATPVSAPTYFTAGRLYVQPSPLSRS